ncbi:MAG: hypothetical protein LBM25_04830 [Bacteroidales bacterium]|jgi:hypothetical protein|nr:hypothetical protein [Bacteroidales bacterium]
MNNKPFILFLLSLILIFSFSSCNKEEKKGNITRYEIKEVYHIPNIYGISGYHIKDTINNIYGAILFPINKVKDSRINIEPLVKFIGSQMQKFMDGFKEDSINKEKKFIEIRPAYFSICDSNIYSCLIKKTECKNEKDTIKTYITFLYNYSKDTILSFDDIFALDSNNFDSFIKKFDKKMNISSLKELKATDFNIEDDSIAFNVVQNKITNSFIQKQFKQSIDVLREYFVDKNYFIKPRS